VQYGTVSLAQCGGGRGVHDAHPFPSWSDNSLSQEGLRVIAASRYLLPPVTRRCTYQLASIRDDHLIIGITPAYAEITLVWAGSARRPRPGRR
jgi:hypothetical protein